MKKSQYRRADRTARIATEVETVRCQACLIDPVIPGWEVCQSCAYAITAFAENGDWREAPPWLVDFVFGKDRVKS